MRTSTEPVNLEAPIWRIDEVAAYLRLPSTKCAYRIVGQAGFPMSVVPGTRNKRWLATEVKRFLEAPKSRIETTNNFVSGNLIATEIVRKRKVKAA